MVRVDLAAAQRVRNRVAMSAIIKRGTYTEGKPIKIGGDGN